MNILEGLLSQISFVLHNVIKKRISLIIYPNIYQNSFFIYIVGRSVEQSKCNNMAAIMLTVNHFGTRQY